MNKPALELQSKWMPATLAATEMKGSFHNYRVAMLLRIEATDADEVAYTEGQLKIRMQAYRQNEEAYAQLIGTPAERRLFDKSKRILDEYLLITNEVLALAREGNKAEAIEQWRSRTRGIKAEVINALDALAKYNAEGGRAASEGSTRLLADASKASLVVIGLAVVFQLLANLIVYRRFSNSLSLLQRVGVRTYTSANEFAGLIHHLEASIEEQAASSNEIVASAKEISATARELGCNMDEIARVALETSHNALDSQDGLDQLDDTMRHMARLSNEIASKLGVLDEKAGNINSVVKLIGKIAEQTMSLSPRFDQVYEGMKAQNLGTLHITEAMSQFNESIHQTVRSVRGSEQTVTLLTEASQDVQRVVKALG
ncbi:MAG: methyl-accepting chemotaxis protein [Candidatus Methylumidiphilus sp.]